MTAARAFLGERESAEAIVQDGVLSIPAACGFLVVSSASLYRLMDAGELPHVKIGARRPRRRRARTACAGRNARPRKLPGAARGCAGARRTRERWRERRRPLARRPTLLLHDRDRLLRILTDAQRPVQLLVAGKAHPADEPAQAMIREWFEFVRRPEVQGRAVFLPDYDLLLAERLVHGADLWINTPRRPWEASGTSGMKVLVNGGLNLSELDGWWAEAFTPAAGRALGDGREHGEDPAWEAAEAREPYTLLEHEIVPAVYDRSADGIPKGWIARMRESMALLAPRFSANRVVREYTEEHHLPAAAGYRRRAEARGATGGHMRAWQGHLQRYWSDLRFGTTTVETRDDRHRFSVEVNLGRIDADSVCVELYAEPMGGGDPVREPMSLEPKGLGRASLYVCELPASRPAWHYTPRAVPHHTLARVPLEAPWIFWQDPRKP